MNSTPAAMKQPKLTKKQKALLAASGGDPFTTSTPLSAGSTSTTTSAKGKGKKKDPKLEGESDFETGAGGTLKKVKGKVRKVASDRKKTSRACGACQKAHLTCDDGTSFAFSGRLFSSASF